MSANPKPGTLLLTRVTRLYDIYSPNGYFLLNFKIDIGSNKLAFVASRHNDFVYVLTSDHIGWENTYWFKTI